MEARSRSSTRKRTATTKYNVSPPRPKRRERSSSRGRPKKMESPAKTTATRKSPERKSPSRRSPARKQSEPSSKSPRLVVKRVEEVANDIRISLSPSKEKVQEIIRRSVSKFEEFASEVVRRSSRLKERSLLKDDDEVEVEHVENNVNSKSIADKSPVKDIGNWFLALVYLIALPAVVIAAQLSCTKTDCSLVPGKITLAWRKFFDVEAALWYLGFLVFQFILACIPLGPRCGPRLSQEGHIYRRTGPVTLILTIGTLFCIQHYLDFPMARILGKGIPILVTSILTGFLVSICLYVKSRSNRARRNLFARTGNVIYDFWLGREVNPRLGPCDIKTTLIKSSFISIILYNGILVLRELETKTSSNYNLLLFVISAQQILFSLDFLLCESSLLSSFLITQEGTGAMLITALAVSPFALTIIPKYIFYKNLTFNIWVAAGCSTLFLIGLILNRVSSYQKSAFKEGRTGTFTGRRPELLKTGLWGVVRHPNYSGVLLMYTSWSLLCLLSGPFHWVSLMFVLTLIELVIHIHRVEVRSRIRHVPSWNIYVQKTPSRLIPFIY